MELIYYTIDCNVVGSMLIFNALVQTEAYGMTQTASPSEQTDIATLFAETLELPNLIRVAVARSPRVRTAKARWQATIEQYPQATALPDPDVHVRLLPAKRGNACRVSTPSGLVFHKHFHTPAHLMQLGKL